jgi:uncharacterized protein
VTLEVRDAGPEGWKRPVPAPDHVAAEFWRAAAQGQLLVQRCLTCGHRQHYPRAMCTACWGAVEWLPCSGRGVVHTFSLVRARDGSVSRVVAVVELDEGPRMMGNITDVDPEAVQIGMPVVAYAVRVDDEIGIPQWRPASV